MDWIERLNRTMEYLEEHMTSEIDYGEAAKLLCCSVYHFQRMFSYMANMPLSEYVRRRRMSLAAADLQSGAARVVDVALKYGYDSPTAFNRAFQSVHGIAPSQARVAGVALKAFPPIRFSITIKGDAAMNYRIEQKEAFRIVGVSKPLYEDLEQNFTIVPQMWGEAAAGGLIPRLAGKMDSSPMGLLGVSACHIPGAWRYFIAVASSQPADEGLEEYTVPASTWAIFSGEGDNRSIQELEKRIVTEWLPSSGFEYAEAPDVEVYLSPDPAQARYEVWIPVRRKEE